MEALAAFSLAGTILEFSRFGMDLLRDGRELYKSSKGVLSANEQLELATADLQALLVKLNAREWPALEEENETTFHRIYLEAEKVAAELLHRLEDLKVRRGKSRKLESVRKAIESAWTKDEIDSLMKKLAGFKDAVETHILFSIVSVTIVSPSIPQSTADLLRTVKLWMKNHFGIPRVSIVSMTGHKS
jgi:hypothetical protein